MGTITEIAPVAGRILIGLFYLITAVGLIKDFKPVTGMMADKGIPAQPPLLAITILIWIIGGGALLFNYAVVKGALLLMALTIIVTPFMHNFWKAPPELFPSELQHFLKNVAILGGLLAVIANT